MTASKSDLVSKLLIDTSQVVSLQGGDTEDWLIAIQLDKEVVRNLGKNADPAGCDFRPNVEQLKWVWAQIMPKLFLSFVVMDTHSNVDYAENDEAVDAYDVNR